MVFPLLRVCLPPMKSFLQTKPKDHHYKLIFLLIVKGAYYSSRDRNKTLLSKPNTHLSSALLALTAELFVVSVCFLPAEMDVSLEIPLVWDTLPAVPRARCPRRWKTPSRARPALGNAFFPLQSPNPPSPDCLLSKWIWPQPILGAKQGEKSHLLLLLLASVCSAP